MVIKSRNLKDRPYNGQRKKDKKTNNDRQNTTQKTKDGATQTPTSGMLLHINGKFTI